MTEKQTEDPAFLEGAARFLDLNKWSEFILKWASAVEAYGTPRSFVESTAYKTGIVPFNGKEFELNFFLSTNHDQRRALMAQQKPYQNQRPTVEYGLRMDYANCFLCQNLAQSIDALTNPEGIANNVIYDVGNFVIMPNRYPSQYGHSLFVLKNHDDTSGRVPPIQEPENRTTRYTPEQGKTRGNIVDYNHLEALMATCDRLHLVAVRNHVLDGMSIPAHDHEHVFPEDLPTFSLAGRLAGDIVAAEGGHPFYSPADTPFDTRVIKGTRGEIAGFGSFVMERMERDDQVFTFAYHNGALFISPRDKEAVNDRRIQIGAGIPLHFSDTESPEFFDRVNRLVPMKGSYDWKKYVE